MNFIFGKIKVRWISWSMDKLYSYFNSQTTLSPTNSRSAVKKSILRAPNIYRNRFHNSQRSRVFELPFLSSIIHTKGNATPWCTTPNVNTLNTVLPNFQSFCGRWRLSMARGFSLLWRPLERCFHSPLQNPEKISVTSYSLPTKEMTIYSNVSFA